MLGVCSELNAPAGEVLLSYCLFGKAATKSRTVPTAKTMSHGSVGLCPPGFQPRAFLACSLLLRRNSLIPLCCGLQKSLSEYLPLSLCLSSDPRVTDSATYPLPRGWHPHFSKGRHAEPCSYCVGRTSQYNLDAFSSRNSIQKSVFSNTQTSLGGGGLDFIVFVQFFKL